MSGFLQKDDHINNNSKPMNKKHLAYVILIPFGVIILLCMILQIHVYSHRDDYKERTTPLPKETIETLCANFEINKDDRLCNGKKEISAPDFYNTIRDTFRPYEAYNIPSSEAATYEEVQQKIGDFQYECESVVYQADGFTYFICSYDLRGDRALRVAIMFTYPENAVFRIMTPIGDDD